MKDKLIELLVNICEKYAPCEMDVVADHLIANGVTLAKDTNVPSWIPVSERLPKEYGRYLCNVKSFLFPGSFYQTILQYVEGGFIEGRIYTDDVTHWMPLPEPPK